MKIENITRINAHSIFFSVFFVLVLCLPFLFIKLKIALGIIVIIFGIKKNYNNRIKLQYYITAVVLIIFYAAYVIIPLASGAAHLDSIGYTLPLYVVFTSFWLILLATVDRKNLAQLSSIAVFSAWVVLIYAIAILTSGLGIIPFHIPDIYGLMGSVVGVDAVTIGLASSTVSALLFTAPILTFIYLSNPTAIRVLLVIAFWLGVIALGRRSALLGLGVSLILVAYAATISVRRTMAVTKTFVTVTVLGALVIALDIGGAQTIIANRAVQFDLPSESERIDQSLDLLNGFRENPLIGNGLGVPANVVRNEDKPWRYEMSVPAALFRYGSIGYLLLTFMIGGPIVVCLLRFQQAPLEIQALLCGSLSQFVAYLVNPVFDSFDTAFQFFLPIYFAAISSQWRRTPRAQPLPSSGNL